MSLSINPEDRLGVESEKPPKKTKKGARLPKPPRPPKNKRKLWPWLLKWSCILMIWGLFVGGCVTLWYSYDLPDITKLQQTERRPSITVLAKDGTKLATYGDLHGQMVDLKKLPPYVVQALLSIEDRRFYSHFGVDVLGLLRAIWVNYRAGHVVQGGSTITQQLAKNFLQSEKLYGVNDRSLRRKVQEALLALWLERNFSKDQILTMYLNRVYLGSGTFGLAAAAQHYFGKRPQDLSLYEAAVIMGLLKAPSKYSPSTNPDLADQRAAQVLENMQAEGFITEDVKDASLAMASTTSETFRGSAIRYFTDWIVDILPTVVDVDDKDVIVTTTLDPQLQSLAEAKVQQVMEEKGDKAKVSQ
ncbi:MAG: penicillin-binding protein, partial [Alphaproteobacteria bacterium]|nr:penicillin-binding protein [Alphaproteobacteria bacterium]